MDNRKRWGPSPAMVVALVALFVALGGGAYALSKNSVGTKQLKNGAVTKQKLRKNAVTSPKVRNGSLRRQDLKAGAVSTNKIAPGALGVAIAGARYTSSGTLLSWFNRRGGQPSLDHPPDSGIYRVTFPGTSIDPATAIPIAMVLGGGSPTAGGEIRAGFSGQQVFVATSDSAGTQDSKGFSLVLYDPD